ncbi:MAG TPA: hypothetical protein VF871_03030 [Burkholderiales bacterium]
MKVRLWALFAAMSKRHSSAQATDTLPPELLAGIEEILYRWSRLEFQLGNLIVEGFSVPKDTGRALIAGTELNAKCGMLKALTFNERWIKDDELRKEIRNLADEIREKSGDRQDYAHGVFGFDLDGPNAFARYLFKTAAHSPPSESITPEGLKAVAEEVGAFVARAVDLTVRLIVSKRKSASIHNDRRHAS